MRKARFLSRLMVLIISGVKTAALLFSPDVINCRIEILYTLYLTQVKSPPFRNTFRQQCTHPGSAIFYADERKEGGLSDMNKLKGEARSTVGNGNDRERRGRK